VLRQVRKADLAGNGVPLHLRHVVNEPLYAAQMREKALMNVALAPRGRRNETLNLNSYGLGILAGMGWLDVAEVARLLVAAGTASGLDPNEVRATVRSGLGEGVRQVAPEQADFVQRLVDEVGRR
jgi:hypothetical protein